MPRNRRPRSEHRQFVCAIRALEEAEGLCERCDDRPGAVAAVESPRGSGRFAVVCINRPECDGRVVLRGTGAA